MAIKDYSNIVANARKKKKEDENNSSSSSPAVKDYSSVVDSQILSKSINFDTLSSDLSSLSKTIDKAYSGWQSRETMENTRASVQSMYDRLGQYQNYQKKYGGTDLSELRNSYKSVIDGWNDLSKQYGRYKSADEYKTAVKNAKKQEAENEGMKTADLGAVKTEISDLEKIFNIAKEYDNKAIDYSKQSINLRNPSAEGGFSKSLKKLIDDRDNYLKSVGYESMDALKKALGEKKSYLNRAEWLQKGIEMSSVGDKSSKNYDKDFSKKSKYVQGERPFIRFGAVDRYEEIYDYINADEKTKQKMIGNIQGNADAHLITVGYEYMTDREVSTYNYYYNQDKDKAAEYLKTITEELGNRKAIADFERYEGKTGKELLYGVQAGFDQFASGVRNLLNTSDEYIPVNATQQLSGMIRDDLNYEHGIIGQGAYDLITTTTNMMPSILTSAFVSSVATPAVGANVGAGLMGASAAGNAYQEMLNLGYDKGQARTYSTLVGVAEAGLQRVMGGIGKLGGVSGKLSKAVSGIDNGLAKFAVRWGGSALSEGFEEATQEVLSPLFQNLAAGYDTGADVDWSEVVYSGLLGALSGGVLEGGGLAVNSYAETSFNKNMGQNIKANERVNDLFDIASNPEVASAYETYTRYANKGVTAENISDVQLGRLYSNAKADGADLSVVETENTIKKAVREFNVGEETKVTESGDAIDIKSLKVKGDAVTVATDKGDVSVDDITLTQRDAELVVAAKGILKTDGEDIANLFINQYDGETDVDAYANSFNLAMNYVKNNFPQETILENKGALSTSQVNAIYQATIINESNARETELENLAEKQGNTMTIQGVFDDAIIDYNSSTNDGSKVNWKSLTTAQRSAIKFAKLFSKATGVNIKFIKSNVKDGKHKGKNGSYDPNTNTIEIDVYAGRIDATSVKDSIIPTLSHEITHWMKAKSPTIYNSIKEDVIKALKERTGLSSDVIISKEIDRLTKNHPEKEHSVDEAVDEIVARACEDMLSNSNVARKLLNKMSANEQQSFMEKVKETFENLIQWVNDLLAHYNSTSEEAKILREYKHMLKKISKQWDEMLIKSIKANQALEKSGANEHKNTTNGDVLQSIREEYSNEIEAWEKDGMPKGETFILGTTGDVLQGLGAIESDIYMSGDKIKDILAKHPEMTIDEIKKIPQILENPVLILKSQNVKRNERNNTRLVIYGNVKAQDGKPILSVLDLRPVEKNLVVDDMQKVSSAYTKDSNPIDFIKNSLVVYADKKITTKLLKSIGFQMPIELLQSGYIGSISYFKRSVNINGEEFSKVFKEDDSLRFSMRENVEETKDLIAVHNLSPEKLLKTLKLGGLPMPSIAITRAREGYNNFGAISLVFGKETIDPQFMRSNKIYSGDAWTPTYPQIAYKLNTKAQEKIKKKIDALVPSNVQSDLGGTHLDSHNMEYELNRHGDMVTSYRYNSAMKYAFLKDNNVDIELPTKEEPLYRYGEVSNSAVISFANKLVDGLKTANSLLEQHSSKLMAETELINGIATVLNEEAISTADENSEAYQKLVENPLYKPEDIDLSTVLGMLEAARKYFHTNGKIEQKVDYREAKSLIDEKTDMAKYESWLKDLFSDVVAKEGIRNNKDLYTPSGNRRSFEALHYEHTLENVIKAMKEEGAKGIGGFGGGNIFGASTTEYTSIDDVKSDAENRMQTLPETKYDEIKKGFSDRLFELANSLPIHKDSFSAVDDAANMLIEAVLKFKTKSGMANYLRTESKGWANYSDYIVDDLVELVKDIRNMPVAYFEAKPQRAVRYDEIKAVIMPAQESYEDDVSEVKSELEKLGIPILEYEYGDNNDRLKALNSLEDVRFSDRDMEADSKVFIDVEGKERNILKHGDLGYHVLGTRKYNSYFPSIQEAIDAENNNIKSYYAKKLSVKRSYIDKMLKNDDQFLVRLSSNYIRYSEREDTSVYDVMGETERIRKENEKFKAEVERLKERLKIERKVTNGNYFNENQLGAVAGHLRNISKSLIAKDKLVDSLKDVYSYIAHSENLTWEDVFERCSNVADAMLAEAKPLTIVDDYSKYLLKEIRNTKISLDETQKKEAQHHFGKNWNRYFMGKVIIANDAINIDAKWQEWANSYPDIFDADTNSGDMISELYDIIDSLKEASETIDEYGTEEQKRWLAKEIYNQYWNVSPIRTTADKYDKQIRLLNFEHRRIMTEFREDYNTRLKEQHKADKEKQKKLIAEIRERKDKEIALAKQHGKERLDKYKENAERKTVMQSTMATVMSLNKKLTTNSKDVHIPESLKPVVINLLNSIDFSSKPLLGMSGTKKDTRGIPTKADISRENALSKVHSLALEKTDIVSLKLAIQDALELFENAEKVLNESSDGTVDSAIVALDADMIGDIKNLIKSLDILERNGETTFVMQQMSVDHLKTLNAMVKSINHWAIVADKALASKHKKRISELSMQTIEENDILGERQEYVKAVEDIKTFFNWSNLLPVNAFKRLGNAATEFFDSLRDSQDTVTFNRQEIMDFTDKLLKEHKDIKKWRTDVKVFSLNLPNGKTKTVRMPISYIMSLYCVAKQEDAQRHMYGQDKSGGKLTYVNDKGNTQDGGGITIKGFKEKEHSLKVSKDKKNTIISEAIVKQITGVLTSEQREVADALQKFMNDKGSEWGNAVSMALYGVKKFGVKDYFPMKVSPGTLRTNTDKDERVSMFSIINYGFTKERNLKASQSLEIGDIFDVFVNHMNMVAIYNAYALSIYDIARWYNFKGKTESGGEIAVTTSIENAFGNEATKYVRRLISDLNGQHGSSRLGFISKAFKNAKSAMVGFSPSVTFLQFTAYFKAMTKISPQYLLKSFFYAKDFGARNGIRKSKEHCGIALLKSQGYFETGVSANTTTKLLHDESWKEKAVEVSLKGAEFLDETTWGILWNACEFEVRAKRKDLKVGSKEFYEVIAKKLSDVIYETQVVDSPLTKSDLMRSSDTGAKMVTMFASEMTVAYNMLYESLYDSSLDINRRVGKVEMAARKYIQMKNPNGVRGKDGKLLNVLIAPLSKMKEADVNYIRKEIKKAKGLLKENGVYKKHRKSILMALIAYTSTSVANGIITTAIQEFLNSDDDDEETTFEKFLSNFIADWFIVGKIPYFKEAISYYQGYSASRPDLEAIEAAIQAYKYWGKIADGTAKEDTFEKAIFKTLQALSYGYGVGVHNIEKNLVAILKKLGIID